jgi:hypothetical protein
MPARSRESGAATAARKVLDRLSSRTYA